MKLELYQHSSAYIFLFLFPLRFQLMQVHTPILSITFGHKNKQARLLELILKFHAIDILIIIPSLFMLNIQVRNNEIYGSRNPSMLYLTREFEIIFPQIE